MKIEFILFLFGLGLSFILNLIFNQWFLKTNRLDPINLRSSHQGAATKTGGIALFSGLFFITLFLYSLKKELFDFSLLLPLGILFITGVYDDFYNADFKLKFFIQIIAAKLLIDQGFIIDNYYGFLGFREVPYFIAQLTTVFVFLLIVNSVNFIDGIDGLAASISIFSILSFEFLTVGNGPLFIINIICISLLIPYYLFNARKKNKVFLGDAGSLFLGGLITINLFSFLSDQSIYTLSFNPTILSIVILFYPLIDLLRVFIIRLKNGDSPFTADKNHLHHKLSSLFENHYSRSLFLVLNNVTLFIIIVIIEIYFNSIFSVLTLLLLIILILFKK